MVGGSVFLSVQNFAKIQKIELKREYIIATIFLLVKKKFANFHPKKWEKNHHIWTLILVSYDF